MKSYRLTTVKDHDLFYQLYLYAFNRNDSEYRRSFFNPRYEHAATYGIKQDGQMISALYMLPFKVNFHGQRYSMGGVGDVMSAPEYSGRGGASQLIREALADMYQEGVELSYLAPFSLEFYRRLGYEQTFNHIEYRIACRDLPRVRVADDDSRIVRGTLTDMYTDLKSLFERSDISQRGGIVREDWWWQYLDLRNGWDVALYCDASGVAKGYLIYSREGTQLTIKEFVAESVSAHQHLLSFIVKHQVTFDEIIYDAPDTDFLLDYLPNGDNVRATIKPYMMARIVHLGHFMSKYPVAQGASADLVFKLSDNDVAANDGYWHLCVADGKIHLEKVSETADAAQISIQQLTKIFMGAQSATELAKRGQIIATADQATEIDSLRVKQSPSLVDYF